MNLLAIETATDACSVVLLQNQTIFHRFAVAPRKHTEMVLPMVDEVCQQANIALTDLNYIAYGQGPGAFTGLRITAGVVQGLAFALQLQVIAVSTLAALAHQVFRLHGKQQLLVGIDARMGEIYWGGYQFNDGIISSVINEQVAAAEQLIIPENGMEWCGVGSGWLVARDALLQRCSSIQIQEVYADIYPDATDVAILAQQQLQYGYKQLSSCDVTPLYLRNQVIQNQ